MNTFIEVMLTVVIITGGDKPDIKHREPMPDMATCLTEAAAFVAHHFPDEVEAKGLAIGCSGKMVEDKPS